MVSRHPGIAENAQNRYDWPWQTPRGKVECLHPAFRRNAQKSIAYE
jgi:hypothetical protein